MSRRLIVSNLSASTTNLRLEQLFSRYGRVSGARVAMDQATGYSEGHGYVQMGSPEEALRAIEALQGKVVDGQALDVRGPTPQEEEAERTTDPQVKPRYGNGRGGGGVRPRLRS